jgi:ATP-dependent Lhr-like helicase
MTGRSPPPGRPPALDEGAADEALTALGALFDDYVPPPPPRDAALAAMEDLFEDDLAAIEAAERRGESEGEPDVDEQARHEDRLLRQRLVRTWYPVFGRFGRLTSTQRQALPSILDGHNVLLMAPTATGKTEAFAAGLIERHLPPLDAPALRLVLVAPTRALCNDLVRRLELSTRALQLKLALRTSDGAAFVPERPPDVIVTTPESLDSLLSRYPRSMGDVRAVVVDEVHLLADGPRGDQLAESLGRLQRVVMGIRGADARVQRVAASASVSEPHALVNRFLCGSAVQVRVDSQERPLDFTVRVAVALEHVAAQLKWTFENDTRPMKRLVFVNRRADAEQLAAALAPHVEAHVHHGSLSHEVRMRTEKRLQLARRAVCVATSTLEVGVDIGDVDETWLVEPPPDVASFLQRVGRGNRRQPFIRAVGVADGALQSHRFWHLASCAQRGKLFDELAPIRPAVVAQQILALAGQNPRGLVTAESAHERLSEEVRARYTVHDLRTIIDGLVRQDYLESSGRAWKWGEEAERDRSFGRLHVTFSGDRTVDVRDELTGRTLGSLPAEVVRQLQTGGKLSFGGQNRQIVRQDKDGLVVKGVPGMTRFVSPRGYGAQLSRGLSRDFGEWCGWSADVMPWENYGSRLVLGHFLGHGGSRVLSLLAARLKWQIRAVDPFMATLEDMDLRTVQLTLRSAELTAAAIDRVTWAEWLELEPALEPGRLSECVPHRLRAEWVVDTLRVPELLRDLARRRWVQCEPGEIERRLCGTDDEEEVV